MLYFCSLSAVSNFPVNSFPFPRDLPVIVFTPSCCFPDVWFLVPEAAFCCSLLLNHFISYDSFLKIKLLNQMVNMYFLKYYQIHWVEFLSAREWLFLFILINKICHIFILIFVILNSENICQVNVWIYTSLVISESEHFSHLTAIYIPFCWTMYTIINFLIFCLSVFFQFWGLKPELYTFQVCSHNELHINPVYKLLKFFMH